MVQISGIDYSQWKNKSAFYMAKRSDKNGVPGLQGTEVFGFVKEAKASNLEKAEIFELMGLNIPTARAASSASAREKSPEFIKAVDCYNTKMDQTQRHSVTVMTNNNLTIRMRNMERDIETAYQNCAAFNDPDIMVVRTSPYRYWSYTRFYDRLIKFDIDEIRTRTTKDMDSLNEIREKVEHIIKDANGETNYEAQKKTEYDVDAIAKKHLGMSYQEFAKKYAKELEQCKYVTYADLYNMDSTMAYVYDRAKSYAAEMLDTTILEAHNTHWDTQERLLYASLDASSDVYAVSEFEWEGITDDGLNEIQTGLMYKSFEEALIDKYREIDSTGIGDSQVEQLPNGFIKVRKDGKVYIYNPAENTYYDLNGHRIK